MNAPRLSVLAMAVLLAACSSGPKRPAGDNEPTLASLRDRTVALVPDPANTPRAVVEEQTITAYRQFLDAAPKAPQRPEAMRRLGDLEMDSADRKSADSATAEVPDYKAAIARYEEALAAYPDDPRNDRVLYQLARARESAGQLEASLQTLNMLVSKYPGTVHADEAQFRRGEMLFAMRNYKDAETAYATVLANAAPRPPQTAASPQGGLPALGRPGDGQGNRSPFTERALYMQGWSLFKQGRVEDALQPFFAVFDLKLAGLSPLQRDEARLEDLRSLSRADRELLDDTFRVVSISLASLQGAESIPRLVDVAASSKVREGYQFRVYQQLAELYIRQERVKDAADALSAFVRRQPLHVQAPLMQARVIEIYAAAGFDTQALSAKKDHVGRYGVDSEFRRANPSGWQLAQPLVKTHLVDLARHHHALAQKSRQLADVQEAIRWYDLLLTSFPQDAEVPANRFLLAELLFDDRRFERAVKEFNTVAYPTASTRAAPFARAADAGYSSLLATIELEKAGSDKAALRRQSVQSGLLFARAFPGDPRVGSVLTNAAEQLLSLKDGGEAVKVARQALALTPAPAPELRRVAWTVMAIQSFETGAFAEAETAYGEVLALTADKAPGRAELVERQAAAIYKQGEAAREAGLARDAVGHFARIASLGALPAASAVRASALLDTAVAQLGLKDWDAAARTLEDFRRQHPNHPAQADVAPKLALAYMEGGKSAQAAVEFERVAATAQDPALARGAQWQAAELRHKAADKAPPKSPLLATAIKSWERYLQAWPQPVEPAVQARWQLAQLTRQDNQLPRSAAWLRAVQAADRDAGDARTPLTRSLGGQATLTLSEPLLEAYRKVPLIEPLQKQLKLKKAKMDDVLKAYAQASEAGVADVTTAATFQTAALYQDFGKALIASQRPKGLKKLELEQYNVLLEEQAFPFEEKAIELHETNARRTTQGLWDAHVQKSLAELAKLKPVRYGKVERGDAALGTDIATLQAVADKAPASAAVLNQLGIAQRQAGRFDAARKSYEAALAADPKYLPAQLNLAILLDLYMGDVPQAQAAYQKSLELSPGDAQQLNRWMAELKGRKPVAPAAPAATAAPAVAASTKEKS